MGISSDGVSRQNMRRRGALSNHTVIGFGKSTVLPSICRCALQEILTGGSDNGMHRVGACSADPLLVSLREMGEFPLSLTLFTLSLLQ